MDTESKSIPTPPPLPPAVYLEIIFGAETGRRYPLGATEMVVGRGEAADFILDDSTVSRRHAAVTFEAGSYQLRDLGSANGTRVDGRVVEQAAIVDGTTLGLGGTILQVGLGEAPAEAPATGPLHRQDTVKLPALDAPPEQQPEVPPDPAPRRRMLGLRRSSGSSALTPSPLFSQIVSWLVILCIVLGGVLLLLNLLETGIGFEAAGSGDTIAISAPRQDQAQRIVERPKKKKNDEDSSLGDLPVDDAPDVAQEKYVAAAAARAEGDLETALTILLEVSARYPEFQPSGARTVPEQVSELQRAIEYAGVLNWGRQVMDDEGTDVARLQHLLGELTSIPATEQRYGEEAIELADQARRRLRELASRPAESPAKAAEPQEPLPEEAADVVESPAKAADQLEEPSSEDDEAVEVAQRRADELYRGRAFTSAASRLREVSATLPEGHVRGELEETVRTLLAFDESFGEARRLARKQGNSLQRVDALEKALRLDEKLSGKYVRELRNELAGVLVELASADLDAQRYESARDRLDRAHKRDRSAREVARLSTLFAFRGASLLRSARAASDPGEQRRLARGAQLLASPGSPLHKEAVALLESLGGEAE